MEEEPSTRRDSNAQLLQDLEALSQSLYQSHTTRRHASLALPRSAAAPPPTDAVLPATAAPSDHRPRPRRLSMSPWRSRPKPDSDHDRPGKTGPPANFVGAAAGSTAEKKGIWNWKPMRALSHIRMNRLGCLFSVEVVTVHRLPASMNGLRLCIGVRKKESKDGAVQTMPARVLQGSADFEEVLFLRCHVYCSGGAGTGKPLKFEPRPFLISTTAVDAPELDFGKCAVDLSLLVQESMEKSVEGARIRQWETSFRLSGKAKGGELVLKLGFQIMEDGGLGIYNQAEAMRSNNKAMDSSPSSSFARKQSKTSFSVTSPRVSSRLDPNSNASTPSMQVPAIDLKGIDDFNLDDPAPTTPRLPPPAKKTDPEAKAEELDMPEFEVVDKGIEIQSNQYAGEQREAESEEGTDEISVSSEVVVKEVVHDPGRQMVLTELDSIAAQIMALESMIGNESDSPRAAQGSELRGLDADEESVTREFLQMLELEQGKELKHEMPDISKASKLGAEEEEEKDDNKVFVSDLGKGLGSVVQTKDGGYLAATNPFNVEVPRRETPKLAMQISKPFILQDQKSASGFEVFQRMAAMGSEELSSELLSLVAMDELMGKTAEQIAFEGIASAIINGRNKEGASSSAARAIASVKAMAAASGAGRKERILTGIWNVSDEPVTMEDIIAFSLQKIEAMAIEALKIQADVAEEEAPFHVFTLIGKNDPNPPLATAVSLDDWAKNGRPATGLTLLMVVQLRDPLRRFEAVGAPIIALLQAIRADSNGEREEERFKVGSLHVGGLKVRSEGKRSNWDGEKQRLTAMQWLVAYGLGKAGKKGRAVLAKEGQDLLWSISSRIMADMWLKPMRNPDVKFPKEK